MSAALYIYPADGSDSTQTGTVQEDSIDISQETGGSAQTAIDIDSDDEIIVVDLAAERGKGEKIKFRKTLEETADDSDIDDKISTELNELVKSEKIQLSIPAQNFEHSDSGYEFYLTRKNLFMKPKVSSTFIAERNRYIKKIRFSTFGTPYFIFRLILISENGKTYEKKNISVKKGNGYILNLNGIKPKGIYFIHQAMADFKNSSHVIITGIY